MPLLEAPVSKIESLGADVIDNKDTVVETVKQLSSGDEDEELPVDAGGLSRQKRDVVAGRVCDFSS